MHGTYISNHTYNFEQILIYYSTAYQFDRYFAKLETDISAKMGGVCDIWYWVGGVKLVDKQRAHFLASCFHYNSFRHCHFLVKDTNCSKT